jgi:hypothetical protein
MYDVCFEKHIKYVSKATYSMIQKITLNMSVFVIICFEYMKIGNILLNTLSSF